MLIEGDTKARAARIRELNDHMRADGPIPFRWMMRPGIVDHGPEFIVQIVRAVCNFTTFDEGNDPYGERDFGAFDMAGEKIFWKIDYYAPGLKAGSEDPADPSCTIRILTIMLAWEY